VPNVSLVNIAQYECNSSIYFLALMSWSKFICDGSPNSFIAFQFTK